MTSTKETKRTLVKQLARYKTDTGSTYEDLGKELGYTHGAVYNWLSGTYLPTEKNVDTIKIFLASKGMTTPTARLSEATVTELLTDLRAIKEREGLNFEELGEKIGVSENAVANWFRGVANPSALNAYHIKNFLAGRDKQTNLFESLFETQVQTSDLTLTAEDGTQYVSSRSVAEWTEKEHKNLLRDIENYISYLADDEQNSNLSFGSTMRVESYFVEDSYQVEEGGRRYKFYWCSRKGCEMIANKMTGKKGVLFTLNSVERLNRIDQEGSFKMDDVFGDIFQTSDNFGNVLNLVEVDGVPYTTSRMMAEKFNKDHSNVLKELDRINNGVSEISLTPLYIESTYIHEQNKQEYREILVSKKGCLLYMFNIQGYQAEKMLFIESFERMEQALKADQPTPAPEKLTEAIQEPFKRVGRVDDLAYIKSKVTAVLEGSQTIDELHAGLEKVQKLMQVISL